jgi:uncharacterized SAM-binding protein YcdF (DUF218 family)
VKDNLRPADGIYILAGGNGSREVHGAELYQQGLAGALLLCQSTRQVQGHRIDATRLVRAHLKQHGVPEEAIHVLPGQVRSTWDEAARVIAHAAQQGWQRLILVTDPYHTRRALMTFNRAARGTQVQIQVSPCASELLSRRDWSPEMRLYFLFFEFLKVGYYLARCRLSWRAR